MAFFDQYPRFYGTSSVGNVPNRLNSRYRAMIEENAHCIQNCSILDIASHDGRWSFSALKAGARHVLGIEARPHLVNIACDTFRTYGIPGDKYSFVTDDIYNHLPRIRVASVDTVFCFGFFYHTLNHQLLLSGIANLRPRWLLLDTCISPSAASVIEVRPENTKLDASSVSTQGESRSISLVGHPSWKALKLMVENFGFRIQLFDWHAQSQDWTGIEDYRDGTRITLRGELVSPL
jgi:SAM-dependent methyltransferase